MRGILLGLTFYNLDPSEPAMSFQGRVIAVTGAASGIGLALTLLLVKEGAKVFGSDVNAKGLEATAAQCIL